MSELLHNRRQIETSIRYMKNQLLRIRRINFATSLSNNSQLRNISRYMRRKKEHVGYFEINFTNSLLSCVREILWIQEILRVLLEIETCAQK